MTADATTPLSGVRVIEISSFVAVPLAGMTLAQLGAEVTRVEVHTDGFFTDDGKGGAFADLRHDQGWPIRERTSNPEDPRARLRLTLPVRGGWMRHEFDC